MYISIEDYEAYLYDHYQDHGIDTSLFMKMAEEVGEVANEIVDVIHYSFAIAALNIINLNETIIEKDKLVAIKYHHDKNLEQFLKNNNGG